MQGERKNGVGCPCPSFWRETRSQRIIATNENGNIYLKSANFYLHCSGEREYYCGWEWVIIPNFYMRNKSWQIHYIYHLPASTIIPWIPRIGWTFQPNSGRCWTQLTTELLLLPEGLTNAWFYIPWKTGVKWKNNWASSVLSGSDIEALCALLPAMPPLFNMMVRDEFKSLIHYWAIPASKRRGSDWHDK